MTLRAARRYNGQMNKAFVKEADGDEDEEALALAQAIPAGAKNYITPAGYRRIKDELLHLIDVERPEVVKVVHWAASNGDRSENGDYIYGKRRLRQIDGRIRFLTKRMDSAAIVDPALHFGNDQIFFGATVRYRNAAGDEIDGPARWLTVRSDGNDKFAQPDGLWIGRPGLPTFVTAAGPELRGAASVVIPKIDHRETSFSPAAFDAGWRFLTGAAPLATTVQTEAAPVLDGIVSGLGVAGNAAAGNVSNNLPVAGATVEIYPTDPDTGTRRGGPAHRRTVGPDGRWGPFTATAGTPYEFVVSAQGYAITHIYRSGFPRSSNIVHLRAERIVDAERSAQAVVSFTRPRGYFDLQRNTVSFDGSSSLPDVPPTSGAGVAASKRLLADGTDRAIVGSFNGEKVVGRTWPLAGGHLAFLELTY